MVKIVSSKDPRIPKGAVLLTINNKRIDDFLEYRFYNDAARARRILIDTGVGKKEIVIKPDERIRIKLEEPRYRHCENDCAFCFVNGLPRGLRKELYFRDDDYRLSFLFGNFLSLTNLEKKDIARIGRLKLSPLYVSVHTTIPVLRSRLFKNRKAGGIMRQLAALVDQGVKLHCQVVVIPRLTDGRGLVRTITDLARQYPGVASIGVVPVGRTKYLKGIFSVSRRQASGIVDLINDLHDKFRKRYDRGLVYLADEFFVKIGRSIPERSYYDDFPQQENGIGMLRIFIDEIRTMYKIKQVRGKILMLTGRIALPFVQMLAARLSQGRRGRIDVLGIVNQFFGKSVTVSGLISGQDFSRAIENIKNRYDRIILPPNCVNDSGRFIDDWIIDDRRVIVAPDSLKDLMRCLR